MGLPKFPLLADLETDLFSNLVTAAPTATMIASDGARINWDQCNVYEFLLGCSAQLPSNTATILERYSTATATTTGKTASASICSSSTATNIATTTTRCSRDYKSPRPALLRLPQTISRAPPPNPQTPAHTPPTQASPDTIPRVLASHTNLAATPRVHPTRKPRPRCTNCGVFETSVWRKDERNRPMCNACGLFRKHHGYDRPQCFPFRKSRVVVAQVECV
ncbi:hypothetical protein HDU84_006590 [Entophlyctis sp. JEL0112]|nr:hypothetical protein HDU84_006590 [Entophlyctis sp. JEL0112]